MSNAVNNNGDALESRMESRIAEITSAYKLDEQSGAIPVSEDDIPLSYESITDEWLTAIMCKHHVGAEVISHRLDIPDDATSNRRRIFLQYNAEGEAANLPESVFCKASQTLDSRITLNLIGGAETEANFFNIVRPRLTIEAPFGYHGKWSTETFNHIVVLEDIGDKVIFCDYDFDITKERAKSQLTLLAKFHGTFYESPELTTTFSPIFTWEKMFGFFESVGLGDACARGFMAAESVIPGRLYGQSDKVWPATLKSVEKHGALPHTIQHGDVHIRNWYCVKESGEMGLHDWQFVNRGHWSRDVAYTISSSLSVENRRNWEQELLQFYLHELQEITGQSFLFSEAFENYGQQLLTSLAFWTATLTPLSGMVESMQPKDATIEMIRRIATAIDDLDVLQSFKE